MNVIILNLWNISQLLYDYVEISIIILFSFPLPRMWDMSDCTCMASGDRRFLGNFFDLNFISITFERKSKVLEVFLDMSLVR